MVWTSLLLIGALPTWQALRSNIQSQGGLGYQPLTFTIGTLEKLEIVLIKIKNISIDNPALGKVQRLDLGQAADKLLADNGYGIDGLPKDHKSESVTARTNMMRAIYAAIGGLSFALMLLL